MRSGIRADACCRLGHDPEKCGGEASLRPSRHGAGSACLNRLHGPAFGQFRSSRAFGQFYGSRAFGRAVVASSSQPLALLDSRFRHASFRFRFRLLRFRSATARGIFLAVDRRHVRRISIEIGPPDSEFLAAFVDPFPELFSGDPSLRPGRALDAHDIGRKPAAIAARNALVIPGCSPACSAAWSV